MKITRNDGHIMATADSFRDLAEYATTKRRRDESSSRRRKTNDTFYTYDSFESSMTAFIDGEDAPADVIDTLRESVRQRLGTLDVSDWRFDHAIIGQFLDVSTFVNGGTHYMMTAIEDTTKRRERFVRILVDATYWSGVPTRDILTRGGAVIALCDALNFAGYTTEVWAAVSIDGNATGSTRRRPHFGLLCPVQLQGHTWDTRSAAFPLANGDYLRRAVFAVQESLTETERESFNVGAGYGYVRPIRSGDPLDLAVGGADIIVDSSTGAISEIVRDPFAWVISKCRNVGAIVDAN